MAERYRQKNRLRDEGDEGIGHGAALGLDIQRLGKLVIDASAKLLITLNKIRI